MLFGSQHIMGDCLAGVMQKIREINIGGYLKIDDHADWDILNNTNVVLDFWVKHSVSAVSEETYVGQAVDGHFESLSMIDAFLIIEKCFFGGIGLYPQWNQKHGGFHLDTRKVNAGNRWIQYGGLYITLNEKNFKLCEGV
jgi:hypothetical protein